MGEHTHAYRPDGIDDAFLGHDPASGADVPPPLGGAAAPTGTGPAPVGPRLGVRGWLRWAWRQLTSMRVALMLLMLLAVAAVPGSVLPQRPQNPAGVLEYLGDHPRAGEWLDRLGLFDVYTSVWFSAIYLLLFVSLIGCIIPRTAAHLRGLRARPPRVPRRFARFPVHADLESDATPAQVVNAAAAHLRGKLRWLPRFRLDVAAVADIDPQGGEEGSAKDVNDRAQRSKRRRVRALPSSPPAPPTTLSAERGYLRETGNLLFHLALVGLLVAVAYGQMFHYRGQAIVTEGRGFANAVVDYDTFERGSMFRASSLPAFSMTLDSFDSDFSTDADSFGQSRDFTAHVTVTDPGADSGHPETIKVNHPLVVEGAKVYLQGNGFAPQVTIRDADGQVAFSGRVPFLPQDQVYTSRGVIKVPDVSAGLDQIGLVGYLLPTAEVTADGARSVFPQPLNPLLVLDVYRGDLGLDDGTPQNVYRLDTSGMQAVADADGATAQVLVAPGQTVDLPDGLGTITFESLPRYVALDLRHDPSLPWVLTFALLALTGLALSLFTPRRRVWVRAVAVVGPDGAETGTTRVEVAGLARGDDAGLDGEVAALIESLPLVRRSSAGNDASVGRGEDRGSTGTAGDRRPGRVGS